MRIRAVSLNYRDIMVSKGAAMSSRGRVLIERRRVSPPYDEDVREGGKRLIPVSDGAPLVPTLHRSPKSDLMPGTGRLEIVSLAPSTSERSNYSLVFVTPDRDWVEGDMTVDVLPAVVGGASSGPLIGFDRYTSSVSSQARVYNL